MALVTRTLSVLAAAAILATLGSGLHRRAMLGDGIGVVRLLESLEGPDAHEPLSVSRSLARLGEAAVPDLFDALVVASASRGPAAARRADVVLGALESLPAVAWRACIGLRIASSPGPSVLQASLDVLARCGTAHDLGLVVRCATLAGDALGGGPLERAITAILVRDESGYGALESHLRAASSDLHPSIVKAVADTQRLEGARVLARWIETRRELRLDLLAHLARLAASLELPLADDVAAPVRRLLADGDPETLQAAIVTAGRIEDSDSIAILLRWQRDGNAGVRGDASWALRRITGLGMSADPATWSDWYRIETTWWERESASAFDALRGNDRGRKVAALAAMSSMRAWRSKLAREAGVALEDPDPEVARLAGIALGRLGSATSVPALVAALGRREPRVADAAWRALRAITGKNLPSDPEAWRALVVER